MAAIYTPPVYNNVQLIISNTAYAPPAFVECGGPSLVYSFTTGNNVTMGSTFTLGTDINMGTPGDCSLDTINLLILSEPIPIVQNAAFLL